jgi:hypothetical protein
MDGGLDAHQGAEWAALEAMSGRLKASATNSPAALDEAV